MVSGRVRGAVSGTWVLEARVGESAAEGGNRKQLSGHISSVPDQYLILCHCLRRTACQFL